MLDAKNECLGRTAYRHRSEVPSVAPLLRRYYHYNQTAKTMTTITTTITTTTSASSLESVPTTQVN